MRHLKRGRKLGRNASHRRSLKRNLLLGLFAHERITTTVPKGGRKGLAIVTVTTASGADSKSFRQVTEGRQR